MIYIIIIVLVLLIIYLTRYNVENFEIPFTDPYSLYLHADTTRREEIWNLAHTNKLYYYYHEVPHRFTE